MVSDKDEHQQDIGSDEEDLSLFKLWHLPIIRLFSQLESRDDMVSHRVCIKQIELAYFKKICSFPNMEIKK